MEIINCMEQCKNRTSFVCIRGNTLDMPQDEAFRQANQEADMIERLIKQC